MRRPQLQSTFARATVPVAAGIAFFGLVFALLWGVAAMISNNSDDATEHLSSAYQEMGRVEPLAATIDDNGPIILPDLVGDDRHIVLDHTGADATKQWAIYLAHPADRESACAITQVKGTREFTDCEGRTLQVADLATPPQGVSPIVNRDNTLTLSLRATSVTSTTPTT